MADDSPHELPHRIVEARLRLRDRYLARMQQTAGVADAQPLGSGPPNRHGMPKIPVGQTPTAPGKWPVLDLGIRPIVPPHRWSLTLDGACRHPVTLDWKAFLGLEQIDDVSDFHCVTGWSRLDVPWRGVRFATVAALVEPDDDAAFVACHASDGYTSNLPLAEALKDDVLLVHGADGAPLSREHGGPVRLITPQLYAWKGAKWIKRIELMPDDRLGFWEQRGYSNTRIPGATIATRASGARAPNGRCWSPSFGDVVLAHESRRVERAPLLHAAESSRAAVRAATLRGGVASPHATFGAGRRCRIAQRRHDAQIVNQPRGL